MTPTEDEFFFYDCVAAHLRNMRPDERLAPAMITTVVARFIAHIHGETVSHEETQRWPHAQRVLFQRMTVEYCAA